MYNGLRAGSSAASLAEMTYFITWYVAYRETMRRVFMDLQDIRGLSRNAHNSLGFPVGKEYIRKSKRRHLQQRLYAEFTLYV